MVLLAPLPVRLALLVKFVVEALPVLAVLFVGKLLLLEIVLYLALESVEGCRALEV